MISVNLNLQSQPKWNKQNERQTERESEREIANESEKAREITSAKSEAFLRVARFIKSLIWSLSLIKSKNVMFMSNEKIYTLYRFCIKRSAGTVCFKWDIPSHNCSDLNNSTKSGHQNSQLCEARLCVCVNVYEGKILFFGCFHYFPSLWCISFDQTYPIFVLLDSVLRFEVAFNCSNIIWNF